MDIRGKRSVDARPDDREGRASAPSNCSSDRRRFYSPMSVPLRCGAPAWTAKPVAARNLACVRLITGYVEGGPTADRAALRPSAAFWARRAGRTCDPPQVRRLPFQRGGLWAITQRGMTAGGGDVARW